MKIQCSGCDGEEEARVFCCADEAALCYGCDHKIHSTNKLVSKHQRVPLSPSSSPLPKCDICQETFGYFLCLEDRALLCRKCDVAIHTMNSFTSSHQRFLLPGVKVGLEFTVVEKVTEHLSVSRKCTRDSIVAGPSQAQAETSSKKGDIVESQSSVASKMPVDHGNIATTADSQFMEILGSMGSNQHHPCNQDADAKVSGSSEWWKILRSAEEQQLLNDEWTAPDAVSWTVPELLHPYSLPDSCSPQETTKLLANNVLRTSDAGCLSEVCSQNSPSIKSRSRLKRRT